MEFLVAQILSGVSLGGQYALIAIGYTMVYGILRLINFAHGDVFMCAGLMMVFMCASLPVYVSIPLMLVLTVLLGFVIERAAYKPLRSAPRMSVMISAIGVSYLLQNVALYATGAQNMRPERRQHLRAEKQPSPLARHAQPGHIGIAEPFPAAQPLERQPMPARQRPPRRPPKSQ